MCTSERVPACLDLLNANFDATSLLSSNMRCGELVPVNEVYVCLFMITLEISGNVCGNEI